ncbi:MAG: ATP-binding protein, partial [Anaerolineae bacterium]
VRQDSRFFPDMDRVSGFKTQSILCVPLQTKGRLIGAIEAMNKLDGEFTPQDLNRLTALTAPAATAIEHAQLYHELAQRMTQVDNLRAFNQNIIENMTTGLIALDRRGTITVFNKAASALLGIDSDTVIGQPLAGTLAHIPQLLDAFAPPLADRQPLIHKDIIIEHWDGGHITVSVTTAPMVNAEDEPSGVVGLIEDLTALKTLEAERRRLDRLAALGEMSAVVAHELRNPLAGIAAGVNYLTKKILAGSPDHQAKQMILKEVDRVQHIIEDILLVARPLNLQPAPQPLNPIITAVRRRYRPTLQEKKIQLGLNVPSSLPDIFVDRAKFEQALNNLFENAIHAMPNGGRIAISAACPAPGSEVVVTFKDTGPGILTADPQKVFEPFFTTKNRGTGLGLALSRRIIEAHRGSIAITASDKTGTTFEIRLPTGPQAEPA